MCFSGATSLFLQCHSNNCGWCGGPVNLRGPLILCWQLVMCPFSEATPPRHTGSHFESRNIKKLGLLFGEAPWGPLTWTFPHFGPGTTTVSKTFQDQPSLDPNTAAVRRQSIIMKVITLSEFSGDLHGYVTSKVNSKAAGKEEERDPTLAVGNAEPSLVAMHTRRPV